MNVTDEYYAKGVPETHRRFAENYALNDDYSLTARQLGYDYPQRVGRKMINNPLVQALVASHRAEMKEQYKGLCREVVLQLAAIGGSDLRSLFDERGEMLPPGEWPEHMARAVSSIKTTTKKTLDGDTVTTYEVRLWDKVSAIDKLARILSMYAEDRYPKQMMNDETDDGAPDPQGPLLIVDFTGTDTTT